MTSRCTVPDRQVLPVFVVSKARLLTKKRAHMDENDSCTHLLCRLIFLEKAVAKKLARTQLDTDLKLPHVQKIAQSCEVEVLRHFYTLPTVPATSVRDVCKRSADLVIWLNVINVTEHSSLPSLPNPFAKWLLSSPRCRMETAPGFSLWALGMPECDHRVTSCFHTLLSNRQL